MERDVVYAERGNKYSDQAEQSTLNPAAGNTQMRILIELQVISMLLLNDTNTAPDDLAKLRKDIAASIT